MENKVTNTHRPFVDCGLFCCNQIYIKNNPIAVNRLTVSHASIIDCFSETRLVEITDHHVCTDSEKQVSLSYSGNFVTDQLHGGVTRLQCIGKAMML